MWLHFPNPLTIAPRATIKVQIEDILRELAKNIVSTVPAPSPVDNATENIGKTTSSASLSRRDIATQTDGHRASITIGPFPDGEAAVRADLSLTTAELIVQTSKAKGLDIALAESRDLAETLKAERSHLLATIASLESRLEISTMERQSVNKRLDLAGKEVKQLQDIICSFHNPQSKMFESIRDAVIRESNGQRWVIDIKYVVSVLKSIYNSAAPSKSPSKSSRGWLQHRAAKLKEGRKNSISNWIIYELSLASSWGFGVKWL